MSKKKLTKEMKKDLANLWILRESEGNTMEFFCSESSILSRFGINEKELEKATDLYYQIVSLINSGEDYLELLDD